MKFQRYSPQRVAMCCNVLQCAAVCCSLLQCNKSVLFKTKLGCSDEIIFQRYSQICAAVRCSVLQYAAVYCSAIKVCYLELNCDEIQYSRNIHKCVLQCAAVCSVLQCNDKRAQIRMKSSIPEIFRDVCCSMLQYAAVCSLLQCNAKSAYIRMKSMILVILLNKLNWFYLCICIYIYINIYICVYIIIYKLIYL